MGERVLAALAVALLTFVICMAITALIIGWPWHILALGVSVIAGVLAYLIDIATELR